MRSRTITISKLAILVAIAILFLFEVYAGGSITPGEARGDGTTGQSSASETSQQVNDWMANQGSGSINAPAGTEATTKDNQKIGLEGNVNVQSGNIASADYLSFNNAEMTGVEDFFQSGVDFIVSFVNSLTLGSLEIINGRNIEYKNGILKAGHADSLEDSDIYKGTEGDEIKVEHAELVKSGTTEIAGVKDTGFLVSSLAVEIYPKNGTILNITDSAGNKFSVEALGNNSKIILSKAIPPTHIIRSAIFKHTYGNITEGIIAKGTVKIEMGEQGIKCLDITPVATFYHTETIRNEFAVNFPAAPDEHRLCLRKQMNDEFAGYDSLVDYVDNEINLRGLVNYLRSIPYSDTTYSYGLKYVYEGKQEKTNANIQLDGDMVLIYRIIIDVSNVTDELASVTHNGFHSIYEYSNNKRYDFVSAENPSPSYIRHYESTNIPHKVWFNKSKVRNTLVQLNEQKHSRVSVYPPTNDGKEHFIAFLSQSYAEHKLENEI